MNKTTDQLCKDLLDAVDKMSSAADRTLFKKHYDPVYLLAYWCCIGHVKTTEQTRDMLEDALCRITPAGYVPRY